MEVSGQSWLNEGYRLVPYVNLFFLSVWFVSGCSWSINSYKNRHFQINNLQWTLATVPFLKFLQLSLSFLFWYSCFFQQVCSLWMSFGVYVTGILFQTASFVSFLLISHGYCIVCERLSATERRATAALGCVFYLVLIGYRASVPYFSVLLLLNYFICFYLIFYQISRNLSSLRDQLTFIEDEDIQSMHDAVYAKYIMFKKFQGMMQIVVVSETLINIGIDASNETYWLRLLCRELVQFFIFMNIGWIFRTQDVASHFSIMPVVKPRRGRLVPPIYSVEMDATTFKREWHIGVPTSSYDRGLMDPFVVVIQQHPHTRG